jgi:methionyl-tRNA formyltransferase
MTRAVVFAYHNVGVQCLSVLLKHGIEVPLVLTHTDNPSELIWFDSVAALCKKNGITAVTPDDANTPEVIEHIRALKPDFLFSFYYRNMLKQAVLDTAARGALNMHGSLLPKYRGRVPVNWAVINGETETGATLHYMAAKPDAGDIVGQQAVPILADDTAADVFGKVTVAAAQVLDRHLPALVAGTAPRLRQDLAAGGYFGGRKPADGRIDWAQTAARVHNLVRGVAPPYPGAFTPFAGGTLKILRSRLAGSSTAACRGPAICATDDGCVAVCADGTALHLLEMEFEDKPFSARDFLARFGDNPVPLEKLQQ